MDHVQQILIQQLRGEVPGGTGRETNSETSFDLSGDAVDWAEKAKQWAEEQRKQKILEERRLKQVEQFEKLPAQSHNNSLQGWKDEHPSWFGSSKEVIGQWPEDRRGSTGFSSKGNYNQNAFQARFTEFQAAQRTTKSQKKNRNRQNHRNKFGAKQKPVGTFPDFVENDSRNLPKWMQDEIERLQAKQADGEQLEEKDQQNLSELQQLADREDSNSDSSEDDWKIEGRKISEDLAKANSKSDSEDSSVTMQEELTQEIIDQLKNEVLSATMKSIFLKITDELTGKICRNVFSKGKSRK